MGPRSAPRDIWTCCIFVLNVFFFLCPNLYRNSSKQTSVVLSHFLKTKTALCLHKCCGFCHYKICVWLRHLQKRNEKYTGGFVFSLWTTFPFFSLYVTISLGRWALDGSSVYKLGIIPSHFFPSPHIFPPSVLTLLNSSNRVLYGRRLMFVTCYHATSALQWNRKYLSICVHVFDRLWKTVVYGFGAQHWEFRPFLICAVRTTLRLVYLGRSRIGWTGSRFVNIQVFHKPFCLVRKKNQWSANVPKFSLLIKLRSADFMESRYPEASSHAYPVV